MKIYIADVLQFSSKLTLGKLWNATKVFTSYQLSRVLKQPIQWGMPFHVSIEPTTSCNLRCPECPSGLRSFTRETGMLQQNFFKKTIDETHQHLLFLYLYFQGEPYLNPHFLDMAQYASSKGIYTVTSTNAHYLDEERARDTVKSGLDRIIISIDGATQATYQAYRVGGQLDKVLQGTRNLVKWKKALQSTTPHIVFQFLVVKPNEHEIGEVQAMAKQLGVDEVKLKTAQVYDFEHGNSLIPSNDQFSRYKKMPNGTYRLKNALLNHCWKLWHACVITWDGKIVPCCFDKDAAHQLGDLNRQSLRSIWQSNNYQQFRGKVLSSRKAIDICTNCTEGTKVWA